MTTNLWNEILCSLRNLPKKEFKREVRRRLLDILVQENDYIETPIILKKVRLAKELCLGPSFTDFSLEPLTLSFPWLCLYVMILLN